jgi:hypothetical protein
VSCAASGALAAERILDDFEKPGGWTAMASAGTVVEIAQDSGREGMGLRIDFDFRTGSGFVFVRKEIDLSLPENFAFTFWLRGEAKANDFQFKMIDPAAENVWWRRRASFKMPADWEQVVVRKSRFEFAWGPSAGKVPLKRVGSIEFAIAAVDGGKGSVWIDDLRFEQRRPAPAESAMVLSASTFLPAHEPRLAVDGDLGTFWKSGTVASDQWVLLDFTESREYGGLVIDWGAEDYATQYTVEASDDETAWKTVFTSQHGNGGRDYVYLPEGESRFLRVHMTGSSRELGYAIANMVVKPFEFSASPNQFFGAIANDSPPGSYPKYFYGKQTYWTVVGVETDEQESLINQEGMVEVSKGSFSIEPFLYSNGRLISWSDVALAHSLRDGYLPIPSVDWRDGGLKLKVTAFVAGTASDATLHLRYRVRNERDEHEHVELFLVVRPFQVNPSWQSLNMVGGVSEIRDIVFDGRTVLVNDRWRIVSPRPASRFGAVTFEGGPLVDLLASGEIPADISVHDPFGFASGVLHYDLELPAGAEDEVQLLVPYHENDKLTEVEGSRVEEVVARRQDDVAQGWRRTLDRVELILPAAATKLVETNKSSLAYMLINRDGPAIQPGSRNYSRSWIRDGAMSSAAFLEMGFTAEVRAFLEWFAVYQAMDGRVPCCVDWRGADPVPEHDSYGQFIYAIAEYYRFTRDIGFVSEMWPHIVRAVDYIAGLRQQRTGDDYRHPERAAYYGLLPESISHEGYSAHPVHSYWDNFFTLRGLKDAAMLALVVGDGDNADRFAALRDSFDNDLHESIARTMATHKIDFVPGSVELGDFDPTSTTVALLPGGELAEFEPAIRRTFERYHEYFVKRRAGEIESEAYTPYELRSVAALVRLGQRQQAIEVLEYLLQGQRPPGWNHWAEVVWRDGDAPRFIGDMPHTWVGSGFIRSLRTMLAYEREDGALVLAGGAPLNWFDNGGTVGAKRLPTHYGVLHFTLRADGDNRMVARIGGDLTLPPGGVVLNPPLPRPIKAVSVNQRPLAQFAPEAVVIREVPADVVIEY